MAIEVYTNLCHVISSLGLQEALDKLCPPSTFMEFISITFNTITSTISIPVNNITEIMALVRTWQGRSCATKHQLKSLLGKLHHVSNCVKPARLFVSMMLDMLCSALNRGRVALSNADFQRDLQLFTNFLPTYNSRNMMQYVRLSTTDLTLEVDAWLTGILQWILFYPYTNWYTIMSIPHHSFRIPQYSDCLKTVEAIFHWPLCLCMLWQHGMCLYVENWSIKGPILTEVRAWNLAANHIIWLQHFRRACHLPG